MLKFYVGILVLMATASADVWNRQPYMTPSAPASCPRCYVPANSTWRSDYTYIMGYGGYKLHLTAAAWNVARKNCQNEGGHLAIINSSGESEVIRDLLEQSGSVHTTSDVAWIGMHNLFDDGEWVTIYGQPISQIGFSVWHEGEPNNGGVFGPAQHCGGVNKFGRLVDKKCSKEKFYLCEQAYFA